MARPRGGVAPMALNFKAAIREITGHEPETCPWRALYDPVVREVMDVATLAAEGLGSQALTEDTAGVVLDGLRVYYGARNATRAYDWDNDPNNPKNRKK